MPEMDVAILVDPRTHTFFLAQVVFISWDVPGRILQVARFDKGELCFSVDHAEATTFVSEQELLKHVDLAKFRDVFRGVYNSTLKRPEYLNLRE